MSLPERIWIAQGLLPPEHGDFLDREAELVRSVVAQMARNEDEAVKAILNKPTLSDTRLATTTR